MTGPMGIWPVRPMGPNRGDERLQSVTSGSFGKVFHPLRVKSGKSIGRLRSATERSLRSMTAESAAAS